MYRHSLYSLIGVVLVAAFAPGALGQQLPQLQPRSSVAPIADQRDNATIGYLRQQERERVLRRQQEQGQDVRLPRSAAANLARYADDGQPCFKIERVLLVGEGAKLFDWALAAVDREEAGKPDPIADHCIGMAGINLAMRRVQNAILVRGYVTTRVLAEAQNITSGTLQLTVLPGRVREVRFAPGTNDRATQWNAVPVRPGDLLNLRNTEQALENFKRVPTVEADIEIAPAEGRNVRPGESDLVVRWKQGTPFRISLSVDDGGARTTGRHQGSLTLSYDHWWTLNDLFYVSFNRNLDQPDAGGGTRGLVAHYSIPLGYWLLSTTGSDSSYRQTVAGMTQDYVYSGENRNRDIKLARMVYRDASRKTTLSLRGWSRASKNFIDDTEVEVQRRRTAGWELGIGHREFFSAATLDLNLQYRRGTGAEGALLAPEEAFGEGRSRAGLWLGDANLAAPFKLAGQGLRYGAAWRGQTSHAPLLPQDRFSIGGRYTVRGYDGENSLLADHGWLLRNELALALGGAGHETYLALDHGRVSGRTAPMLVARQLTGAAVGLRGQLMRLQYEVFAGRPIDKPADFRTARTTYGFNLAASY
jgi:hemolysin activation/secretion protein